MSHTCTRQLSEVASLLDWAADFGLVEQVESSDGELCYARFDTDSARYAHRLEQTEAAFERDAVAKVQWITLVVFAIILFGSLALVAVGGILRLVDPAPIWEQTAETGVDGLWIGLFGLIVLFVVAQIPSVLRRMREHLEN